MTEQSRPFRPLDAYSDVPGVATPGEIVAIYLFRRLQDSG